jgi:hypothetical protein
MATYTRRIQDWQVKISRVSFYAPYIRSRSKFHAREPYNRRNINNTAKRNGLWETNASDVISHIHLLGLHSTQEGLFAKRVQPMTPCVSHYASECPRPSWFRVPYYSPYMYLDMHRLQCLCFSTGTEYSSKSAVRTQIDTMPFASQILRRPPGLCIALLLHDESHSLSTHIITIPMSSRNFLFFLSNTFEAKSTLVCGVRLRTTPIRPRRKEQTLSFTSPHCTPAHWSRPSFSAPSRFPPSLPCLTSIRLPPPTSSHPAPSHTFFRNCHTDKHFYIPQHNVTMGVLTKLLKMLAISFFVGAALVATSPITAPTDAAIKPNCAEACKNLDAACQFFGLDPDTCHLFKCGSLRVSYRCQLSRGTSGRTEIAVTDKIA